MKLHIDIETYSSVDIKTSGAYKYMESLDFEILMVAYAFDNNEIKIIDLAQGESLPDYFIKALKDPGIKKCAHNAVFERRAFKIHGINVPIDQWYCSAIKAAYCGLPLSLADVSKALKLEEKGKSATGKALIKYFSCPIKPTKVNGQRHRNLPHHDLAKWEEFKQYCIQDVEAEREIDNRLEKYEIPEFERRNYILDQEINDRGIKVDLDLAQSAYEMDERYSKEIQSRIKELTGLGNPNSVAQLKSWLRDATGKMVTSLAKDAIPELLEGADEKVKEVLQLRQKNSKSSTKKYVAMLNCTCEDNRAHGLFQFYGANRTGRWAGRLIQLQNLPQNHLKELEEDRELVLDGEYDLLKKLHGDLASPLSQLIRTSFISEQGKTLAVADFSAIEARVIAWLADEAWRLEVFKTHGKIYEASASVMFGVPIGDIGKGSELRQKGKVAELALGYQGAVGALTKMGGEAMGLTSEEMDVLVKRWRHSNPNIVKLWYTLDSCAKKTVQTGQRTQGPKGLVFERDEDNLMVTLPSGRKLFYHKPTITNNKWGQTSIKYRGMDQVKKIWSWIDTYGGKLTENIVQAIARDLLANSMLKLNEAGFKIVMHVHDEAACEIDTGDFIGPGFEGYEEERLDKMCKIMGESVYWAPGLPLKAEGYVTQFYKKD